MDLSIGKILIVSVVPYFLEKRNFWFDKYLDKIIKNRKIQSFFQDNTIVLERDQKVNLSELLRKLDEMGYEKVYKVSEIGEFSQKGGIVDISPINSKNAIRLDFRGNKIESIQKIKTTYSNEKKAKGALKKKLKSQKLFSDLSGLKKEEYLVHLDHGIGKFSNTIKENDIEYYLLEYAKGDKLYVPFGLERKLSRYIGFIEPKISRLSSSLWQRTKRKIREDAKKLAKELLEIYAKRELTTRLPYMGNDEIQKHLKETFEYEETPDQELAIKEINKDLEKKKPMDRLVCGDVGFGKTEIALRAAVKAASSGYQIALITPTTILANQHFQTFQKRLGKIPINLSRLSRLELKKEQREIIEKVKEGKIDILIGTHRILSNDIEFKKLGLLIIDDEQKFGVKQKEKLKKIRPSLDILSLSATPIPRTLYLSLSSIKSVSQIYTPPQQRLAIKTYVLPWKKEIIKRIINKELKRKGQIYYLHNKIQTIEAVKKLIGKISPRAKIGIIHGRQKEKNLIKTMEDFRERKIDLLIATTIIENGLDFPNVNTLIVSDATKLGLSQAHQIRGRIGRSHKQAFAYFLYNKRNLKKLAKKRLEALKEFQDLGSGYKIALKDLEIRGAGNILGKEQSGSINKVGLNLYCQMLSEAIEKLKI